MLAYLFSTDYPNPNHIAAPYAVTLDRKGRNLPANPTGYPWRYLKTLHLGEGQAIGFNHDEIRAAIEAEGYFLAP